MKKLLFFLLALPLLAMVSCGDDKNPNVDVFVKYKNATVVNGTAYVIKGAEASIDSLWVEPIDKSHVASIINPVSYTIVIGRYVLQNVGRPVNNAVSIYTDSVGTYTIGAVFGVAEQDCALANCFAQFDYKVVADSADIPTGGAADGVVSQHHQHDE